jgi:hypothetical protein
MGKRLSVSDEPDGHQTYVLRLWRASIGSPHMGKRQVFASLEQLFAYWSEHCECQVPPTPEAPGT